jgi:hypothetical protein
MCGCIVQYNPHTALQRSTLELRTSQLVAMRIAERTAKVYGSGASAFIRFAQFYRYLPIIPATDEALAAFVSFQSQSCSYDTLHGYISHVRDLHLRNVFPFKPLSERWLAKSALIGIRRAFGSQKKRKLAITSGMLLKMRAAINNGFAQRHNHTDGAIRCAWAAILIGFFAMLRKDNISSGRARTYNMQHCLIRGDLVFIQQTQALWLRCRFSKTNQFNERIHVVPLQYSGGLLCPVSAYNSHVADYPSDSRFQPAFMYDVKGKRTALSHSFLVKILKQLLSDVGESPELFSGHSLRRGGATLAFSLGVHPSYVMVLGDWASLTVLIYNDAQPDFLQCLPQRMAHFANT